MRCLMSRTVSCGDILSLNEVPITVVTVNSIWWFFQLRSIVSAAPRLSPCPPDGGIGPASFQATSPAVRLCVSGPLAVMLPPRQSSTLSVVGHFFAILRFLYPSFFFLIPRKIYSVLNFRGCASRLKLFVYLCMTSAWRDVTRLPRQRRRQQQRYKPVPESVDMKANTGLHGKIATQLQGILTTCSIHTWLKSRHNITYVGI